MHHHTLFHNKLVDLIIKATNIHLVNVDLKINSQ